VNAPSGAAPTQPHQAQGQREARLAEGLSVGVALGVAAFAFYAAFVSLGPDSLLLPPFDSDGAIPVLMSNDRHWDLFHAFYLGQDRTGAWPFFVAHALSAFLRRPVTPEFLHAQATLFLLVGALPAALLARPFSGLAVLAYTASVLVPEGRGHLFEFAQPYAWHLPLLFWAWWCIRKSWKAPRGWPLVRWLGLAGLVCFLATWTSALSGPLLLGVTVLEGLDVRGAPPEARRRWLLELLPSVFGMAGEAVLRAAYHRFSRATYQRDFHTGLRLDWGHFQGNAHMVWLGLERPVVLAALLALTAYTGLVFLQGRSAGARRRWGTLRCTVLGAFLLAVLPLPVLVLVTHVRLNDFMPRYFVPTYLFLVFGSLLAVSSFLPERRPGRTGRVALLLGTLALAAVVLALVPRAAPNPEYLRLQRTARALAERAPGALLLDGYWGTYVFAGLAPPGTLVPLPRAGDFDRTPANEAKLATAREVLVGHRSLLSGPDGSEPEWLFQYGTLLERQEPRFLSDGVDRFSTYRPRGVEGLPFSAEPRLEGLDFEAAGAEVAVHAEAAQGTTVLAVELNCLSLAQPPSGYREDVLGRTALEVERVPGAVFFSSPQGAGPTTLHLIFGRERCSIRGARWFERPSDAR
jgi:hypothetical protein